MFKKSFPAVVFFSLTIHIGIAQQKPNIKFGKINHSDFTINSPVVDSEANAVVIADIGTSKLEGNDQGWFTLVFTEHKRIKIINRNGFSAADINIGLYKYGDASEKLENLKASTYNLENGSVKETKLDEKSVFTDRISKNYFEKKFTFPAAKEGSIIEYSYTIKSDFLFHLHPWTFQGQYPCLWSYYSISIPTIFNYMIFKQGYLNFYINQKTDKNEVYRISEAADHAYGGTEKYYVLNASVILKEWAMKDVPGMILQDYTSSVQNYLSKLEFQLSEYRFPEQPVENKLKDWKMVSTELLNENDFGKAIYEEDYAVSDELKNIPVEGLKDQEKAKKIYDYVRDNYTCTYHAGYFLTEDKSLRDIIKSKNGSVSDLNILLISLFTKAGLKANPVILSTKSNGAVKSQYPFLEKYNYLICQLKIESNIYYLDASDRHLGFNKLNLYCYNGSAHVISLEPSEIYLSANDLTENKITNISLVYNNRSIKGNYNSLLGYYESLKLRGNNSGTIKEYFFNEEEKKYGSNAAITELNIDSANNYDSPISLKYTLQFKLDEDTLIYFNPMFGEGIKENPFKSQERLYPVELPFKSNTTYNLDLEIPKGYKIEEQPQNVSLALTDNKATFKYQIIRTGDHVQLIYKLQITQTYFDAAEYNNIREFFSQIIKKQNEQVVFRKLQ